MAAMFCGACMSTQSCVTVQAGAEINASPAACVLCMRSLTSGMRENGRFCVNLGSTRDTDCCLYMHAGGRTAAEGQGQQ